MPGAGVARVRTVERDLDRAAVLSRNTGSLSLVGELEERCETPFCVKGKPGRSCVDTPQAQRLFVGANAGIDNAVGTRSVEQGSRVDAGTVLAAVDKSAQSQ